MSHRTTVVGIGVVVALAMSLSGCAGKVGISSKTMCEAHGGSYSAQAKQCAYPAQQSARSAEQICQMQGGQIDAVSDTCFMDNPPDHRR